MEKLPVELLAKIAQYLPVKDLTTCCTVSSLWRDVFGSDMVWRYHCDEDSEEYLRTTPCRVEPEFTSPVSENTTLSPIGHWRMAYMREAHLWRNWIHGNCIKNNICGFFFQDAYFLNNDFVIVVGKDVIELIDTTVEPSVCVANLNCYDSWFHETTVVRSDTFTITSEDQNNVQVVGVDFEKQALSTKHVFCVSESEGILNYVIVGAVFLGLGYKYIHIWNVDDAIKLKTEPCLLKNGFFLDFHHEKNSKDIIVTARGENGDYHCFIYNVQELRFLPFTKRFAAVFNGFAIFKHYVALSSNTSLKVYNYQTNRLLHDIEVTNTFTVTYPLVCVVRDSFIFIKNNDLVQLYPLTNDVRCRLPHISSTFQCFNEKLLYLPQRGHGLWKIGPTSTVKTSFIPGQPTGINQSCSKVLKRDLSCDLVELYSYW